jgi:hypothetical protein
MHREAHLKVGDNLIEPTLQLWNRKRGQHLLRLNSINGRISGTQVELYRFSHIPHSLLARLRQPLQ